jgi:Phage integrase, N-terminal SAM-like domain
MRRFHEPRQPSERTGLGSFRPALLTLRTWTRGPVYPIGDLAELSSNRLCCPVTRASTPIMIIAVASTPALYATPPASCGYSSAWTFRESGLPKASKPRLLDRVRQALRARHLSRRTEEAYVGWVRRFIFFHDKRPPRRDGRTGGHEVPYVAGGRQAGRRLHPEPGAERPPVPVPGRAWRSISPWLDGIVRAKRPERLPVVLTR